MEIIAIESKAFATLVEKIEGIAAYVEASGTKEREQWPVADKKGTRKAGLWMTGKEVCEQLEISPPYFAALPHEPYHRLLYLREEDTLPPYGRGTVP